MNYGQVRDNVLKLLDQYTIAGTPVANSYNNQQDYLNKIPAMANSAIMEIATTARKIPALLCLSDLPSEDLGEEIRYELPSNFFQLISGSIVKLDGGRVLHTNVYSTSGRKYLVVPKEESGKYSISYYRYPMSLAENPKDTDELDNEPETHTAIPYYVAAMLSMGDDQYKSAVLYNKFEDLLSKMSDGVVTEAHSTNDVYGFFY